MERAHDAFVPVVDGPDAEAWDFEGQWRIERQLGRGGMGMVYLATDLILGRPVAIKMMAPQFRSDADLVERFEREARLMAKLDHPNLVPVYSVGRAASGPYLVMKLLEGRTLGERLRVERRLPLEEARRVARQLAAGLQYMHDRLVVHRDLKPANVFVGPDGQVTLLDLGVAREPDSDLTGTGMLVGTLRYMAPEVLYGQPAEPRSDQYALAVIVYEMLTGRRMVDAESERSVIRAHMNGVPLDRALLADIPAGATAALLRALAKAPAERFPSVAAFADALETTRAAGAERPPAPETRLEPLSLAVPTELPVTKAGRADPPPTLFSSAALAPTGPLDPDKTRRSRPTPSRRRSNATGHRALAMGLAGGAVLLALGLVAWLAGTAPPAQAPSVAPLASRAERPWDSPAGGPTPVTVAPPPAVAAPSPEAPPRPVGPATPGGEEADGPGRALVPAPPPATSASLANRSTTAATKPGRRLRRIKAHRGAVAAIAPEEALPRETTSTALVRCLATANSAALRAYLEVDGLRQGATPLTLRLAPGQHRLEFIRDGVRTETREVTLAAGDNLDLLVDLTAE